MIETYNEIRMPKDFGRFRLVENNRDKEKRCVDDLPSHANGPNTNENWENLGDIVL